MDELFHDFSFAWLLIEVFLVKSYDWIFKC